MTYFVSATEHQLLNNLKAAGITDDDIDLITANPALTSAIASAIKQLVGMCRWLSRVSFKANPHTNKLNSYAEHDEFRVLLGNYVAGFYGTYRAHGEMLFKRRRKTGVNKHPRFLPEEIIEVYEKLRAIPTPNTASSRRRKVHVSAIARVLGIEPKDLMRQQIIFLVEQTGRAWHKQISAIFGMTETGAGMYCNRNGIEQFRLDVQTNIPKRRSRNV